MLGSDGNTKTIEAVKKGRTPGQTADAVAIGRWMESMRPEDERICFDPYAIRFISRETMEFFSACPAEARAMVEELRRLVPGSGNSVVARVRYIDDAVKPALKDGLEQLVILGAGYDSRAYRIEGLNKIRVFEVDLPAIQNFKKEKVMEIFGSLQGNVTYVPIDLTADYPCRSLLESGLNPSLKPLFIAEGLFFYLTPEAVDETLAFIVNNSGG